jgi:hypothetical protein
MHLFRVNEVLNSLGDLDGKIVHVEGLLNSSEGLGGGISLQHWPKAEQQPSPGYFSGGIEVEPDGPIFDFDGETIDKWSGKRVVVLGTLQRNPLIDSTMDWFGYPPIPTVATIKARRIDLLKRWNHEHAAE